MPEKSVREMNQQERQQYSLATRVFQATAMSAALVGLATLLLGLALYAFAVSRQYISEAFSISRSAVAIIEKATDPKPFIAKTKERYFSLTSEERNQVWTDDYRLYYTDLEEEQDYHKIVSVLEDFKSAGDAEDIYLAFYDREASAIVYLADADQTSEEACFPGDWEHTNIRGIDKFLSWDGNGKLYDIARLDGYGWMCTSGYPIRDAAGNPVAFVLSDITIRNLTSAMRNFALQYLVVTALLTVLLAAVQSRQFQKNLVRPINAIADAAVLYTKDKRNGITDTDHFASLNIQTGDEVENLSLVMADMEQDISSYEENLAKVISEKERIGTELDLARKIQAAMLPNSFPAFPERKEFDIYASMRPAKEVGGDFYDFFLIDEDRLAMVIADVSGKGVPAALFMMVAKILVKNSIMNGLGPAEALEAINEQICANNREEMFITVWLGILNLKDGSLVAANAGHEYPVLCFPDGSVRVDKQKHGFVIGGMAGIHFPEYEEKLEPGTKLFLYTDGLPDTESEANGQFRMERALQVLQLSGGKDPKAILSDMDSAVREFAGNAPQFDDLTMLCVSFSGKERGSGGLKRNMEDKEISVESVAENIESVTSFINAELEAFDCPQKARIQIDVAADELFANIVQHAYVPNTGTVTVKVAVSGEDRVARITFIDSGKPFDPLSVPEPDITLPVEQRGVGGLGLFLVKKTMDDLIYEYKDGKNIVTIVKSI